MRTLSFILAAAVLGCSGVTGPPEIGTADPERGTEIVFMITRHERAANGVHTFSATSLLHGRPVGFDLELEPWRENPPGFLNMTTWDCKARWRSRGPESDALLRHMDILYATGSSPAHMIESIELQAISPWKNPGDFEESAKLLLLFPAGLLEDRAPELKIEIDLDDARIHLREKDPSLRKAVVDALSASI